jgi:hypothetical protein
MASIPIKDAEYVGSLGNYTGPHDRGYLVRRIV